MDVTPLGLIRNLSLSGLTPELTGREHAAPNIIKEGEHESHAVERSG